MIYAAPWPFGEESYFNLELKLYGSDPSDPVGAEFIQIFNEPWDSIWAPVPLPGEVTQWRRLKTSKGKDYPLRPVPLWEAFKDPERLIGLKHGKTARYAMTDVDRRSRNHPFNSLENFKGLLAALEKIGLKKPQINYSSDSGGLHIWYVLPELVPTYNLSVAIDLCLRRNGFRVENGHLEVFPDRKPFGANASDSPHKAHRIVGQAGCRLLDWDGENLIPVADELNTIEEWLRRSRDAMMEQDMQRVILAIEEAERQRYRTPEQKKLSPEAESWKRDLENIIANGWTGYGQTNDLLFRFGQYGRVFLKLGGTALIEFIRDTAINAPGYTQYCRHQHEIEKRAEERAKSVALRSCTGDSNHDNFNEPYCRIPNRLRTFEQVYAGGCSESAQENNVVVLNGNERSRLSARNRIRAAVEYLQASCQLPQGAKARMTAIIATAKQLLGVGVSNLTLQRQDNLPLWHPSYIISRIPIKVLDPDWFKPWFDVWGFASYLCVGNSWPSRGLGSGDLASYLPAIDAEGLVPSYDIWERPASDLNTNQPSSGSEESVTNEPPAPQLLLTGFTPKGLLPPSKPDNSTDEARTAIGSPLDMLLVVCRGLLGSLPIAAMLQVGVVAEPAYLVAAMEVLVIMLQAFVGAFVSEEAVTSGQTAPQRQLTGVTPKGLPPESVLQPNPSASKADSDVLTPADVVHKNEKNGKSPKSPSDKEFGDGLTPCCILSVAPPWGKRSAEGGGLRGAGDVPVYLVTDLAVLGRVLRSLMPAPILAIDTETTGLDPHTARIRLIQIAAPGLPVALLDMWALPAESWDSIRELLQKPGIKIFQNAKFDCQIFLQRGIALGGTLFDTMIASQLVYGGLKKPHSLAALALEHLGLNLSKQCQKSNWAGDLTLAQLEYAAMDALVLLHLRDVLREKLVSAGLVEVAKLEFDALRAIALMEFNGMLLDRERWEILQVNAQSEFDAAIAKLQHLGLDTIKVNLNSAAQVKTALRQLGVKVSSTDKNSLVSLADQHPVVRALLEYRRVSKLRSAFTDTYLKHINPATGRIHASYMQVGCRTGRMSASAPNLQQVPRGDDVRGCFIAAAGHKIISADYSQIELRVVAEIAGDFRMLKAYRNGQDLHRLTAALINKKSLELVTDEERTAAKALNFGLIYGCGARTLQKTAKSQYGVDLTLEEAKAYRTQFFEVYKGIHIWHMQLLKAKLLEIRTRSNRRRIWVVKPYITATSNSIVQGTAADILKKALALLPEAIAHTGAKIIGAVHDEILLECPSDTAEEAANILRATMIQAGLAFVKQVPIEVAIAIGDSWGKG